MKSTFILSAIIILFFSCKKTEELMLTTFQINTVCYSTGNSIGDVDFKIKNPYKTNEYDLTAATNAHGNYIGSIKHPADVNLSLFGADSTKWMANDINLVTGQNNIIQMEVIQLSNFIFEINCVGNDVVQNLYMYYKTPYPSKFNYISEVSAQTFSSYCSYQNTIKVFPGEWILTYDWKTSPSASTFIPKSDTLTILPGQDYYYTIDL